MKTVLRIITACILTTPAFSQPGFPDSELPVLKTATASTTISLLDSTVHYNGWNASINDWNSGAKDVPSYNSFYKKDGELRYFLFSGSGWKVNRRVVNFIFDSRHNTLKRTYEQLTGSTWTEDSRETCTYDIFDNILTTLQEKKAASIWINQSNTICTYSGNDILTYTHQSWNTNTNSWDNQWKISYTYNTGRQMTSLVLEYWTSGAWLPDYRTGNYIYNGVELASYETEFWNTTTSAFELESRTLKTYDVNHNELTSTTYKWDPVSTSWENNTKTDYTYDTYGNTTSMFNRKWDNALGSWLNSSQHLYYFRTGYVSLNDIHPDNQFNIYPNPANTIITIPSANDKSATVSVRDLSGKTIITQKTAEAFSTVIDVNELAPGLYFVELNGEQGMQNAKFIKN